MQTDEWRDAMEKEFSALVTNKTWVFVPPIKTQNIVGNKWVFWIKRNPDGIVEKLKARLVAKGLITIL